MISFNILLCYFALPPHLMSPGASNPVTHAHTTFIPSTSLTTHLRIPLTTLTLMRCMQPHVILRLRCHFRPGKPYLLTVVSFGINCPTPTKPPLSLPNLARRTIDLLHHGKPMVRIATRPTIHLILHLLLTLIQPHLLSFLMTTSLFTHSQSSFHGLH